MGFWEIHGILGGFFFLAFLLFIPRLTLLFLAMITEAIGITFWGFLGWVFLPRLTVAAIATTVYWDSNPVLCFAAWVVAIFGEVLEKVIGTASLAN